MLALVHRQPYYLSFISWTPNLPKARKRRTRVTSFALRGVKSGSSVFFRLPMYTVNSYHYIVTLTIKEDFEIVLQWYIFIHDMMIVSP
jgi:hypothetical protein